MSSLLAEHEKSFNALITDINRMSNTIPDLSKDDKNREINAGHDAVEEAMELLEQMELCIGETEASERAAVKQRIASYKSQLKDSEARLKKAAVAMSSSQAARDELFAYDGTSEDSRAALLTNTERLNRTSERLQDGHRVAMETTEVAVGIMDNLHDQRDTIERSRGRLRRTDGELGKSNKILNNMIARAKRNKVVAAFIIIIAISLIAAIIYLIASR
ncbi:hypothetical protein PTSG_00192 [Salpingoeca rosetta]|uniref:t-SNARE coiled-coil homology domain-containing protein n=1 Tax=Salpingoeca rosetta (strain ATCC 50818 / BSB-021) TaxID=946362 RepID=F2TVS4_SALR5|nr:uncharacterized protein PTSG_00192 [Salpingoeca rosetta]EGD72170.1 hypothetical protein PTSG_00192 [Salpingoeca rosetta]|eukprot:XP_004998742.1 hypothetical protein PTSG_00192 [Salpingoeca rosetta]